MANARAVLLTLVPAARRQPHAEAVMHQPFYAIGAAVGEQLSTVRLSRTEYRNDPRQVSFIACAYVHRLDGEPDGVDANV